MKKIVATVVLLLTALGVHLFRVQMSKLDEDIVYDFYQKQINATRSFDSEALCRMYDRRYRAIDISNGPQGQARLDMNRKQACAATRESMAMMAKLVRATRVEPEFKYTIESVSLSSDRKQATVKMRASMRIGRQLSVTSTGTETLVRSMGKVTTLGSESRSTISIR